MYLLHKQKDLQPVQLKPYVQFISFFSSLSLHLTENKISLSFQEQLQQDIIISICKA
jgi:hypothetical protein